MSGNISLQFYVYNKWCFLVLMPESVRWFTCLPVHDQARVTRVLVKQPVVCHLIKKFPAFYGTQSSLPRTQQPAICPYPEPDGFTSHPLPPLCSIGIYFNVIFRSRPACSSQAPSFWVFNETRSICFFFLHRSYCTLSRLNSQANQQNALGCFTNVCYISS